MSQLTALRKQIAALEAEAARITEAERSAAVAKIKALMESHGVTVEHLTEVRVAKPAKVAVKKSSAKRAGAGKAKYADPKTGKTWTGFGRVPGWLANARNRDRFLIDQPAADEAVPTKPGPIAKRAAASKAKAASGAVKKSSAVSAKRVPVATKKPAAKKAPAVPAKKKTAPRKRSLANDAVQPAAAPDSVVPTEG